MRALPPLRWPSPPRMPDDLPNPIPPPARSSSSRPGNGSPEAGAPSDDALLITRVRSGEQEAMATLFDRYSGMVYSVALRILRDPGQAEDVMQEIFIQIWRNPDSYVSSRGSLGAWLVVVARNRAIDIVRRRRATDSVEDVVLCSSTDLASEAERNTMIRKVRAIMLGMPTDQQRSIELAFFQGLSHTEIAEQTGDPLGTVKTRIRLALITLRKALQA
jgi:RNA polymerase sigma-70 factor, ECF subfamily